MLQRRPQVPEPKSSTQPTKERWRAFKTGWLLQSKCSRKSEIRKSGWPSRPPSHHPVLVAPSAHHPVSGLRVSGGRTEHRSNPSQRAPTSKWLTTRG
eukprot:301350-Prymnesium_polylepis.2